MSCPLMAIKSPQNMIFIEFLYGSRAYRIVSSMSLYSILIYNTVAQFTGSLLAWACHRKIGRVTASLCSGICYQNPRQKMTEPSPAESQSARVTHWSHRAAKPCANDFPFKYRCVWVRWCLHCKGLLAVSPFHCGKTKVLLGFQLMDIGYKQLGRNGWHSVLFFGHGI